FGVASTLLGCGRKKVTDSIDHSAGIVFSKKSGDLVKEGEEIATLFFNDCEEFEKTKKMCEEAIVID
ncbi:MAG TPA: pyrimidine-nucleoside phosphorylase, partial [Spirochaetota bacterium]|nr:pyrimidine-nucleoside phosphorylase [Spirochaetota bacterium]